MRERLQMMVDGLDYAELRQFREALASGIFREQVDARIEQFENPQGVCPVCERRVNDKEDYVLLFGPEGLRKKARFCGIDCLEFFLYELKQPKITIKHE